MMRRRANCAALVIESASSNTINLKLGAAKEEEKPEKEDDEEEEEEDEEAEEKEEDKKQSLKIVVEKMQSL
jgi:ribosomal protein L12E/L44/L45/RPP1/RPP2